MSLIGANLLTQKDHCVNVEKKKSSTSLLLISRQFPNDGN